MMIAQVPRIVMQFTLITLSPLAIFLMTKGTLVDTALSLLTFVLIGSIYRGTMASYTQLKRIIGSEIKTRKAEALLRATLEAMPDAFAVYSPSGERIVHNANHDEWNIVQNPPGSQSGEQIFSNVDKQWFRHSWFAVPDIGTLSLHSDISIQKRREDALVTAKQAAEIADGARARFVSRMSHELRTPLNGILGFSRILQQNSDQAADTIKEYAEFIEESGEQLLGMVEDVIDYSKIGEDGITVNRSEIDVYSTIQKSIEKAKKKRGCGEQKNFNVRVQGETELLTTDGTVVIRILAALISNAIKFSPSAPDIIITARLLENKWPAIIIRDFGKGMTKSEIAESFSVFYQADESHGRAQDGSGLGLTLARKLAASINADIKIMSEVGRGTAIVLMFQDPVTQAMAIDTRVKA
ncbi:MAG: HAMP domain-containing sensor histidine kinase [Hyphomonadaceae bacterium]